MTRVPKLKYLLEAERVLRRFAALERKKKAKKKAKKVRVPFMTQKEAAEKLGVTPTTVAHYRELGLLKELYPGIGRSVFLDSAEVYAMKKHVRKVGRPRKAR